MSGLPSHSGLFKCKLILISMNILVYNGCMDHATRPCNGKRGKKERWSCLDRSQTQGLFWLTMLVLSMYGMCVCRHDMYSRYVYTDVSEHVMGFCRAIRRSIGISCNWTYRPRRRSSTVELMNAFKAEKSSYNWFLCYL